MAISGQNGPFAPAAGSRCQSQSPHPSPRRQGATQGNKKPRQCTVADQSPSGPSHLCFSQPHVEATLAESEKFESSQNPVRGLEERLEKKEVLPSLSTFPHSPPCAFWRTAPIGLPIPETCLCVCVCKGHRDAAGAQSTMPGPAQHEWTHANVLQPASAAQVQRRERPRIARRGP
mgnify:CR=1 FL=1